MESKPNAELFTALAQAQSACADLTKKIHGDNVYANVSLPDVNEMLRPILAANGLSTPQAVVFVDGRMHLRTIVAHSSGAWLVFDTPMVVDYDPTGIQPAAVSAAAATTVTRRQALMTIFNIAAKKDEDHAANQEQCEEQQAQISAPVNLEWLNSIYESAYRDNKLQAAQRYAKDKFVGNYPACDFIDQYFENRNRENGINLKAA